MFMKSTLLLSGFLSILSFTASAVQISASNPESFSIRQSDQNSTVVVNGVQLSRICWYQGKQYSEGALLEVAGTLLFCLPKNAYETNGALMWLAREQAEQQQLIQ